MITINNTLSGTYFSGNIPDVAFTITGADAAVAITVDGDTIYSETLYPVGGKITLGDLSSLFTPYARQKLRISAAITITEHKADGRTDGTQSLMARIVCCSADIGNNGEPVNVSDFCDRHFLTLLMGEKVSAEGRLEFLHYLGTDTPQCVATYADGSEASFTPPKVQGNDIYSTIDVSPSRFTTAGKRLVAFTVTAGSRSQRFVIDPDNPDCAPVLLFTNSFGCDELLYCTGMHKVSPSYKRSSSVINGLKRNYLIEETRTFKADTGYLSPAMADWADDLFRSDRVRLVNFVHGSPKVGKEVQIDDSKSEVSNADNDLPRFTFSYVYSQHNHNVVDLQRAGRIFDNTFDYTFN